MRALTCISRARCRRVVAAEYRIDSIGGQVSEFADLASRTPGCGTGCNVARDVAAVANGAQGGHHLGPKLIQFRRKDIVAVHGVIRTWREETGSVYIRSYSGQHAR